jgi:hypothetical protein
MMRLAAALSLPLFVAAGDPEGPVVPVPQACTSANTSSLPFCDPKLGTEKRVADLLGRLHADEKLTQLIGGIGGGVTVGVRDLFPPYQYHSEGLHGLRSTCGLNKNGPAKQPGTLFSTLFPQVTAMAATGNLSLIKAMAAHMGDEARAVNNYMQGNTVGKGGGLDYWGPTMNIGRDPVTCQCIAPRAVSLSRCPLPLRRLNANMDRCVRARSGGGGRKNRSRSARGSTEHTRRISFADSRARRTVSVPSRRRRAASTSMPVSHSLRPPQPTAADRAALRH